MQQQNIRPQTQNGQNGSAPPNLPKDESTAPPLYNGVRGLAVKILTRVDRSDAYLDKLLDNTLSNEPLDTRDRRLLKEITTGVLRQRERLDWVLTGFYHGEFSKCMPIVKNALRVALYQILFLDRIPHSAAVNESVELIKRLKGGRSAGIVNGVLRNIIRKLNAITWPQRDQNVIHYLSVMGSHPQWMVRRWTEQLGIEGTEALLKANTERPPVTVRVNTLTTSVEKLRNELESLGITVDRSLLLPNYLHLQKLTDIAGIEAFNNGSFTVQDDGAGLVVTLTGVQPGNRVIDLCAAPGGKSVAMAEMMRNEGEIISLDKYEAKLKLLSNAILRSKFSIIQPTLGDATTVRLDPADLVLVDAPCSGLGVLRRKPEIKWKREQKEIKDLQDLQVQILSNAALLVKHGGVLVYGTCTTEPEENEEVIQKFLAAHPEFQVESAEGFLPDSALRKGVVTPEGFLRTWPHQHHTDGAFGARLRKRA